MSEEFRDDLKKLMGKHAVRTDAVKMEEILEQELNLLKQGRQARKLPVEKASAVTSSSNQHHFPASQSTSSLLPWGPLLHDDYSVTSVIPPNMWWLWLNNYYGQQQQKMMTVSSGGGAASNKIGGQGPSTSGSLGLPPHDQQHQHYPCRFDARRLGIDRTAGPVETANVQPPAPPAHIQQRKRVHCPVLACTKDYADNSSSLRYHVEETHGWHVWRFAVEYKVTHGIDLIGIKDGHPYLIEQHQPTDEP